MNNSNKALRAGVWYTICNFFVKGLTFILMPIFTRIMTSSDIGMFSNITSWFNILAIVTTFEIYSSVTIARFDYKDDLDSYISSSLFLGTIITMLFYIVVLVFHVFFENLFMINFKTLNIIFIYLLVYPAMQMVQIKNRINYDYKNTITITLLNAISASVLSLILTLVMSDALMGRVYGYFIPQIIICVILYMYVMHKGKSISTKYWRYALTISFPLIWHLLAGNLLNASDKIMITKFISADANALYSVPYTISLVVSILWNSMNNAWSPWAYEKMDQKDYSSLRKNAKPYTIFFIIVVFSLMLVTPELLYIMGGEYYLQAKYVMPPVMTGYVFQFMYSLYVNIEFYHKKQKNIAIGTIIAAIINIVLNAIFIPIFGYIAAAYTTLIGYICLFIIHYCMVKKMGCTWWYDTRFFIKVLAISLILMIVSSFLYRFNIIRYCLLALIMIIVIVFVIKNYKELINAIKSKSIENIINVLKIKKKGVE